MCRVVHHSRKAPVHRNVKTKQFRVVNNSTSLHRMHDAGPTTRILAPGSSDRPASSCTSVSKGVNQLGYTSCRSKNRSGCCYSPIVFGTSSASRRFTAPCRATLSAKVVRSAWLIRDKRVGSLSPSCNGYMRSACG